MKRAYQVLAYVLAGLVVVQAMAIAYALAGLGKWVEDDGGVLDKAAIDHSEDLTFRGVGGFALHGISGTTLIPLVAVALLVVAFFAHLDGAVRRAAVLFGLVALQIALGLGLHGLVLLAPLHALNAFGIFAMAVVAGRAAATATRVGELQPAV